MNASHNILEPGRRVRSVNRPYQFKDKAAIRDYFVRLTGLFKNLNYSQEESAQYKEFLGKIQALADATVNQNVKS